MLQSWAIQVNAVRCSMVVVFAARIKNGVMQQRGLKDASWTPFLLRDEADETLL